MERRIVITGANGQLGRALNQVLKTRTDLTIVNTGTREPTAYCPIILDITNPVAVMNFIQEIKPEIIINCAAYTAVDLCESEQERAYRINAIGPKNLATAAAALDAKLIHLSTDYVFGGEGNTPLPEDSETGPINVYGNTKLAGEEFVKSICDNYNIVRTAWLYGEGKNFVRTMLTLAEKNSEIRVVNDQYGSPTSALELARAIAFLIDYEGQGIYHGVCEGAATWYEFALEIFRLAGKDVKVLPITTEEYPTPAKRPKYTVLKNERLAEAGYTLKFWKDALKEYIESMEVKN
ncbi:MAG: dTDP-4-dehydrorhamnose reductase [Lachnoclostridium sp.]|jgi:dTDP-4-dehydrorhamnose reductase